MDRGLGFGGLAGLGGFGVQGLRGWGVPGVPFADLGLLAFQGLRAVACAC